jgi:hypothetical protein
VSVHHASPRQPPGTDRRSTRGAQTRAACGRNPPAPVLERGRVRAMSSASLAEKPSSRASTAEPARAPP